MEFFIKIIRLFLLLTILIIGSFSIAEDDFKKGKGQCREEMEKYCSGIEPGEGRIKDCIEKNKSSFSQGCQERMEKRKERRGKCKSEVVALCGAPGDKSKEEFRSCMKEKRSQLSEQCQKMGKKRREKRKKKKGQD
ncbi:MAG: hypothetical protein HOJ35_11705 [Bdellovibrionales bacterium]|jgi:hypothetical protein|nr:hypothetical protein [Bdellovibrionales bacterium]